MPCYIFPAPWCSLSAAWVFQVSHRSTTFTCTITGRYQHGVAEQRSLRAFSMLRPHPLCLQDLVAKQARLSWPSKQGSKWWPDCPAFSCFIVAPVWPPHAVQRHGWTCNTSVSLTRAKPDSCQCQPDYASSASLMCESWKWPPDLQAHASGRQTYPIRRGALAGLRAWHGDWAAPALYLADARELLAARHIAAGDCASYTSALKCLSSVCQRVGSVAGSQVHTLEALQRRVPRHARLLL